MSIRVTNYKIYNSAALTANVEASQQLSEQASYFEIKCRQINSELKVTFVSGDSGTNYFTIPMGGTWWTKGQIAGRKTLYFQSPQAGTIVEILEAY
ncbi:MAG: hypothetical protein AAB456_00820 [Patescibacteria group bacterium]